MVREYRPRLSVDIPEELQARMRKAIPWGVLSKIILVILEDVVTAIEKDPNVIGAFISRYIRYFDMWEDQHEAEGSKETDNES